MVMELLEDLHQLGYSDRAIAEYIGVSNVAVFRWRKGQRQPPLETLIAARLRCLMDQAKDPAIC